MRTVIAFALLSLLPMRVSAQNPSSFVEGFGGLRMMSAPGVSSSLGGSVGVGLTPNIQAIGEVGRLANVLPSTIATVLAFTPVDFRVSALYGEGGIRLTTDSRRPASVYAEALAGMTRLSSTFGGVGSPTTNAIVNTALRFVNTTNRVAGFGAGLVVQRGPFVATGGYRFSRIFANNAFAALLTGGNLDINEARVGVGVRF
jgi:hypothetical protein